MVSHTRKMCMLKFFYKHSLLDMQVPIKVHQLLHLGERVAYWGPLWTFSCFPFESINGVLKDQVNFV